MVVRIDVRFLGWKVVLFSVQSCNSMRHKKRSNVFNMKIH